MDSRASRRERPRNSCALSFSFISTLPSSERLKKKGKNLCAWSPFISLPQFSFVYFLAETRRAFFAVKRGTAQDASSGSEVAGLPTSSGARPGATIIAGSALVDVVCVGVDDRSTPLFGSRRLVAVLHA